MDIFFEMHNNIPREGPGDNRLTKEAFLSLKDLPEKPLILDIGCGPGMQTLELVRNTKGKIIAIDTHEPFLDILKKRILKEGFTGRVEAKKGSMFSLAYRKNSFDIIWSEGAIYIIGFQRGINEWRDYIKDGGYLVVSEISWLREDIPRELKEFWISAYPGIKDISGNIEIIKNSQYLPVSHFVLPKSGWWNDYYHPLVKKIEALKIEYAADKDALAQLGEEEREIELYQKFSDYYEYVFYLRKKV